MKKFFSLILILLSFTATTVFADVNKDLFKANDSVVVSEEMNGTGFVAGNNISVDKKVNGMLFAAGNTVNIKSPSDYAFAAGNMVNLDNASFKDGFIAGTTVDIKNTNIERDLYAFGTKINLTSNVGRNAFIAGSDIVIDSVIDGDLYVDANNITINSNAIVNGKFKYNDDAKIVISKDATLPRVEAYKSLNINTKKSSTQIFVSKIMDRVFSLLNMLVVGLLMVLLFPRIFKKIKEVENNKLLANVAWGLLVLIAVPVVSIMLMFTMVGVSAGLIVLGLYVLLAYISTIIASYKLSSLVLGNKIKNDYLLLIIGLVSVTIIKLIPFIGGLASFILLCLGLGLSLSLYKRK